MINPSRLFVILRAVLYAVGFVLLWWWLAVVVRSFDARLAVTIPAWALPLGWALVFVGALVTLWCVSTFVARGRGTPAPFDPPREFVAVGPYRYVRNPMYIGGALVLAGYGLFERSPSVLLLAAGFLLTMHLFVLFLEEPGLEQRFGASYTAYKQAVNRWLPRPPRVVPSAS